MYGLRCFRRFFQILIPSPLPQAALIKDFHAEFMDTSHHHYDIYPEERMRDVSRWVGGGLFVLCFVQLCFSVELLKVC